MSVDALRRRLAPELVDWFACEIDKGSAPQLHLVGLQPGDLERCFAAIAELAPRWNDRTVHIDDEGVDAAVRDRPDVVGHASAALAPAAQLRPDPRYPARSRRMLGELIGRVIDDPRRLDYAGGW